MFPIRDHNPSTTIPVVTYALIVANVAAWLFTLVAFPDEQSLFYGLYYNYAMIPARISQGEAWHTLVTSMFLHAGILHLAGNMLFLWIFGDNLEDEMGHLGFLAFYLAAGIGADLAQFATAPWSPVPTVGAPGAIAGVMGGYLLLYPRAKVDILLILIIVFRIIPVPAWLMLGLWLALQLWNGIGADAASGGVAYWAHAGGFGIGLILTVPLWLRRGGPAFWRRTDGHPDHPEATYDFVKSNVPRVNRRR